MSTLRQIAGRVQSATGLFGWLRDMTSSRDRRLLRWATECADFAGQIDCHRLSDSELRAELQNATMQPESAASLSRAIAAASVAMERRLGAWRVFDDESVPEAIRKCFELADSVIESTTDVGRTIDALKASLDEREIVRGVVRARSMLGTVQPADVSLPASFYDAIRALDPDDILRFTPTCEQMITAALLLRRVVVEMDAGEGKTVAAGLAAIVAAAAGRSVHVVTANDYLASRDAEWLSPVYASLGLGIDVILSSMEDDERRLAYAREIVYATAREIGFDYLRDNLMLPPARPVQGPLDTVIVDEADHVLIDQDQTPLIISGEQADDLGGFQSAIDAIARLLALHDKQVRLAEANVLFAGSEYADVAEDLAMLYAADPESKVLRDAVARHGTARHQLMAKLDDMHDDLGVGGYEDRFYFVTDSARSSVRFTQRGEEFIAHELGRSDSSPSKFMDDPWVRPVLTDVTTANFNRAEADQSQWDATLGMAHQLLRAYTLFKRDIDYIVSDGRVVIVDPMNGRLLPDNRYLHGLQAALEAKEGLEPRPEAETIAQITVSGFISRYERVSGLTGTASEAQDEFDRTYDLETVKVAPTHPKRRVDHVPEIHATNEYVQTALIEQVDKWRSIGRPVLIGTVSVRQSEEISDQLHRAGIEHRLLNAVTSDWEAQIVRGAGRLGAVTVATNMAGRGTDIIIEDGLDSRIIAACLDRISSVLAAQPEATIELRCDTREEAGIITDAADNAGFRVSRAWGGSESNTVRISRSLCTAEGSEDCDAIDFGLGLSVIGVALHQSARAERQLRGRAGRQGAFGASRILVSVQEDPIAFSRQAPQLNRLAVSRAPGSGHLFWRCSAWGGWFDRLTTNGNKAVTVRPGLMTEAINGYRGSDGAAIQSSSHAVRPEPVEGPPTAETRSKALRRRSTSSRVSRLLRTLQDEAAANQRAAHESARDYTAVLENQTLSYYRARQSILSDATWRHSCDDMARTWSERFVSRWFSDLPEIGYLPVFEGLVEHLWSELGIDCVGLFGAGEVAISIALSEMLTDRLADGRSALGDETHADRARSILVGTADQLWPGHLSHLRDVALSAAIAGPTHRMAATHFAEFARDAYRELMTAAWDEAMPLILTMHFEEHNASIAESHTPVSEEILSLLA